MKTWSIDKYKIPKIYYNILKIISLFTFFFLLLYFIYPDERKGYLIMFTAVTFIIIFANFFNYFIGKITIDNSEKKLVIEKIQYYIHNKKIEQYDLSLISSTFQKERISKNFNGGRTLRIFDKTKTIAVIREIDIGWNVKQLEEIESAIKSM